MSRPSKMIVPPVGSSSRVMQRAIVDLPQPDSPTTPSVSPARTVKLTPSTALTDATSFWRISPRVTGKYFSRFSTTSRSSLMPLRSDRRHRLSVAPPPSLMPRLGDMRRWPARSCVASSRWQRKRCSASPERLELGQLGPALVHHELAARVERAAGRRMEQRRRLARDLLEPLGLRVEPRQRAEQAPGVGHLRPARRARRRGAARRRGRRT